MNARRFWVVLAIFAGSLTQAQVSSGARIDAYGPINRGTTTSSVTITGRVYYCASGSYHGALDFAPNTCGTEGGKWARAMLSGTRYYSYSHTKTDTCSYRTTGYGNYFLYRGSNGYQFIEAHTNHSSTFGGHSGSYALHAGLNYVGSTGNSTGAHVHAGNMLNWDNLTYWITNYYTSNNGCYDHPDDSWRIGKPRIS